MTHAEATIDRDVEQLCTLFRLLSDKKRLSILMKLAEGERNVTTLCLELALPQPTVSHHLAILRMSNLVDNRRSGKQVFYALSGSSAAGAGSLNFQAQHYKVSVDR